MKETLVRKKDYGIVLLGAGSSTRLGSDKQLLVFNGMSLIRRAANIALEITDKVVAVTGGQAEKIEKELEDLPLKIARNKGFGEGIASSIRLGLSTLIAEAADLKGVIFIVCDQPYLSTDILARLVDSAESTTKGIICCRYGGTLGIPVLFKPIYFDKIMSLKGDIGAKGIVQAHISDTIIVDFPNGDIDIDTPEDWKAAVGKN